MVGWHHQLNGHEFEQALGVGDRQAWPVEAHGDKDWHKSTVRVAASEPLACLVMGGLPLLGNPLLPLPPAAK